MSSRGKWKVWIDKQTKLREEMREAMKKNQKKTEGAEKKRVTEMRRLQERMMASDNSMKEYFSSVSLETQK